MKKAEAIKILLFTGVFVFLFSCANRKENKSSSTVGEKKTEKAVDKKTTEEISVTNKTEKTKADAKAPDKSSVNNNVSGCVVFSNSYCGGMMPPQNILDEYKKTYPFPNSTFILEGKDLVKHFITTDNAGCFSAAIPAGSYDFFMTNKFSKTAGSNFNASCEQWLERNFGTIEIKSSQTKGYEIQYTFGCNPCEPPRP
jgi:hypothetical protein